MFALVKVLTITFFVTGLTFSRKMPDHVFKIWMELAGPYSNDCAAKTNPDPKDVDAFVNRGFVPLHKPVTCFVNCLYQQMQVLKPNGEVHMEKMMELGSYMTPEVSQMCTDEAEWYSGNDMCEKAYILGNCIIHALAV
ncbi:hypothetical protein FQR65_LT09863 [Abscondita terminalis]|nr:hypothetical protein FQR65_LT09863 [Abscondita terminalis]